MYHDLGVLFLRLEGSKRPSRDSSRVGGVMSSFDIGVSVCGDTKRRVFKVCLDRSCSCVSYFTA